MTTMITIPGKEPFECPLGFHVWDAEDRIRNGRWIDGGYLVRNGLACSPDETIGEGNYEMRNFRDRKQGNPC